MENYKSVYFVGAGGIGMSALVRYFLSKGIRVAGYDRTHTALTDELVREGADLFFDENPQLIPPYCSDPATTLVIRTPAVPDMHAGLQYFGREGFTILKRAELLGLISRNSRALCFAGTHGKTTTSCMAAHLLKQSHVDCNAFLGGILKNYDTNLMLSPVSDLMVIEADEYDRSFHRLSPYMAVVTSVDPDHLDIYGTPEAYRESFRHFTTLVKPGGTLIVKCGLNLEPAPGNGVRTYTYSGSGAGDFHVGNLRVGNGEISFDFVTPTACISGIKLGVPVRINVENSVAALAVAWLNGVTADELRSGMASFAGAQRRFDFWIRRDDLVMIDDYAHHPDELRASILSVRELYRGRKLTVIFQPHLYSRTRDFAPDFARSLSLADEVILLDIYPAREKPVPGVTAELIFDRITCSEKELCERKMLLERIKRRNFDVLLVAGAGDVDKLLPRLKEMLMSR